MLKKLCGSRRALWILQAVLSLALLSLRSASAYEGDLMALESNGNPPMAIVPAPPRLDDGSLAPEHRAYVAPNFKINRQFDGEEYLGNPISAPARNPFSNIGQQFGEYMRRISDYFYWFVSGNAPISRKRLRQRPPARTDQDKRKQAARRNPNRKKKGPRRRVKPSLANKKSKVPKVSTLPNRYL
ncbi:hypothetical protein SK128_020474 [Halocaridina rubra]|uniref:Secreted protein n=1 Tax=Halocaridina rubra TaxID=373956 RepID=A0AAN8WAZ4_HALRR